MVEIFLFILQIIILILLVTIFYKLNKNGSQRLVKRMEEWEKEFEKKLNHLEETQKVWVQQMDEATEKELIKITKAAVEEVEHTVEQKTEQLENRMKHYIDQEENEISRWIEKSKGETQRPKRIEMLESAINKYPFERKLVELYTLTVTSLVQSNNPVIRKRAIERYNRVARVFFDNCRATDYEYASELLDHVLRLGNEYMEDSEKKRKEKLLETIERLEAYIPLLEANIELTNTQLEEIERLDTSLDKALVTRDDNLTKRYEKISNLLLTYFTTASSSDEDQKRYNLIALQDIQRAHVKFQQNEKVARKGIDLEEYVELLGGWDNHLFHTALQVYYQSVYSDIFSKLDATIKPQFTEMILKMEPKKVR